MSPFIIRRNKLGKVHNNPGRATIPSLMSLWSQENPNLKKNHLPYKPFNSQKSGKVPSNHQTRCLKSKYNLKMRIGGDHHLQKIARLIKYQSKVSTREVEIK